MNPPWNAPRSFASPQISALPAGGDFSGAAFGLRTLGEGKQHAGGMRCSMFSRHSNPGAGEFHDNFDHPYYYRRNRKAAAIAAHLYNYPANRAACEKIADHYGLQFEVPDFPSWYFQTAQNSSSTSVPKADSGAKSLIFY